MNDTTYISTQTIQDFQNLTSTVTFKDWLGLIALFLSALVAVIVGQALQDRKIKIQAKESLFRTLFSLRGQPINYYYVNALNQIDIVFHKDKSVLEAWHKLYDSLNDINIIERMKTDKDFRNKKNEEWDKLRYEILIQMALVFGYNLKILKPEHLLSPAYSPEGHAYEDNFDWELKNAAKEYFQTSVNFQKAVANIYINNPPLHTTKNNEEDN